MVSFHTPPSPTRRTKRKLNHPEVEEISKKSLECHEGLRPEPDTELHLETPLPLEWQRCLDIKSGQIYFYNTRTHKRTSSDPRSSTGGEPSSPVRMSLDLELNLPCGSIGKNQVGDNFTKLNSDSTSTSANDQLTNSSTIKNTGGLSRSLSWLTFEGEQQEMVTAVCKKCHMLVMMCKSSPSCPNCKFMHPPDQSTPNLLKRGLSLLC